MHTRTAPTRPALVAALALLAMLTVPVAAGAEPENGSIAFYSSRDGTDNIYVMNADGTDQTRLTTAAGHHGAPAWSPDGTQIAFHSSRDDLAGGTSEIYVMNADGTDQSRLTVNEAGDAWAAWSPDGTRIAFASRRDGNWEIYVMDADGSNQTRLTNSPSVEEYPAWSPDGTRIVFAGNADGDFDVYVMDADGANVTNLTNNGAYDTKPAWSPDGTRIAYQSNAADADFEILVMNADGSGQTRLTTTFRSVYPAWSPDGTQIAFASYVSGLSGWEIWTMNADGSGRLNRTNAAGGDFGPAWGVVPSLDTTPPAVIITMPADGSAYLLGAAVAVGYACEDDGGLASCSGDLAVGAPLDTSTVGPGWFTVTGVDLAGNSTTVTHAYSVVWDFDGFFQPVDNPPVMNTVNAGRAIPVRFGLAGDQGLDIFAPGYPRTLSMACDSLAVEDLVEETVSAGGSSLSYDPADDRYVYVWKTGKDWSGTCRQLVVRLADGTEHLALFDFR